MESKQRSINYIEEIRGYKLSGLSIQEFIDIFEKIKKENENKYTEIFIDIDSWYEREREMTHELISVKGVKEETDEEFEKRMSELKKLNDELDKIKDSQKRRGKEVIDRMIFKRLKEQYGW
jgi:hypothetical protein